MRVRLKNQQYVIQYCKFHKRKDLVTKKTSCYYNLNTFSKFRTFPKKTDV